MADDDGALEVKAGATLRLTFEALVSGSDARVQITGPDPGDIFYARSGAGVVEDPPGTALFRSPDIVGPLVAGLYVATWDVAGAGAITPANSATQEIRVLEDAPTLPSGPYYAAPDDLRGDLDLEPADLSDAAANRLLRAAEDLVDRLVGPAGVYPDTGRKYDVSETGGLSDRQRLALNEATVLLAAAEHLDPGSTAPPTHETVEGPDFKLGKPTGARASAVMRRAAAKLDANGLRRLRARASV